MIFIEEKKSVKLPTLTSLFFTLPWLNNQVEAQIEQLKIFHHNKKTGEYEIPITRLFFIVELLIKFDDINIKFYKSKKSTTITCKGTHFKYKPYSYQYDGIDYGLNHNSWLLLDDQGLGKTMQMIYLAETLKKKEGLKHCLIICGVNTLKYTWANEIEKFTDLPYKILGQKTRKNGTKYIGSVADRCKDIKDKIERIKAIQK